MFAEARAELELPGFAFTGEQTSSFSIRPAFNNISVSFKVKSHFDSYLKQESFSLNAGKKEGYSSDDPGGVYSGGIGTSISSVFVGEKAYRNNIVKGFLAKNYLGVIESYNKYLKKIEGSQYEEEVRLVYAFSLLETGSISKSFDILREIASGDGEFKDIASDRVAGYLFDKKDFEGLDVFCSGLDAQTSFTLYCWLYSLLKLERFERLIATFEKNSELVSDDSRFYDFYINGKYALGDFEAVTSFSDKGTENTYGVIADSFLAIAKQDEASALIFKMKDGAQRLALETKLAISNRDMDGATSLLSTIDNDEDRLNVFFFYIGDAYPSLELSFMDAFRFDSRINADYIKFYKGVLYLTEGANLVAVRSLDGIIFNKELINQAYYYRGLAYANISPKRAEKYFLKYIELSDDEDKIAVSRYMLSQLYYLKEMYDEALMLIQACGRGYCNLLRGRIYIDMKRYDDAWAAVKDIKGDDGAFVRASVLYNQKLYKPAQTELKIIKRRDKEADYLMMLVWLKLGNSYEAESIFSKHSRDKGFIKSYLEHLFLAGKYAEVLNISDKVRDQFPVIRAKSLFSLGKRKMAAAEFEKIINKKNHSFDVWYGLLTTYSAMGDKKAFVHTAERIGKLKKSFDKKDFLIYQAARMALDIDMTKLATMLLNRFFEQFDRSAYKRDAYLLRGKLFRDTGRVKQCLKDAEIMLSEGKSEDALFLKGECLQSSDPKKALKIFEGMAKDSGRFKDLGYSKLIDLYTKPADVFKAVSYFKGKDTVTYYEGLDKYLGMLSSKQLAKKRGLLDDMIAERNPKGLAAAYFYSGKIMFNNKKYEEAARLFMKSHYLFPNSIYSVKSLELTIQTYKKLGRKKEISILDKKLKAMKK